MDWIKSKILGVSFLGVFWVFIWFWKIFVKVLTLIFSFEKKMVDDNAGDTDDLFCKAF